MCLIYVYCCKDNIKDEYFKCRVFYNHQIDESKKVHKIDMSTCMIRFLSHSWNVFANSFLTYDGSNQNNGRSCLSFEKQNRQNYITAGSIFRMAFNSNIANALMNA